MKAVIDTSVFISYLLSPRGVTAWLLQFWRQQLFSVVTSNAIFAELIDVAGRDYTKLKFNDPRKLALLQRLRSDAIWTPGTQDATGATPDPKDDMLVSAALETGAEFIVTWDKALLNMGAFGDVRFVDPESFVGVLRQGNTESITTRINPVACS